MVSGNEYIGCIMCDGPVEVRVTSPNAAGSYNVRDYCTSCWDDEKAVHKALGRFEDFEVEKIEQ